jgi:peroxiredoxin
MRFSWLALLWSTSVLLASDPALPVLRPAPDFVIHYPGGQKQALSKFRGKVVALEMLYTTCPHCQNASRVFTKLYAEFGSKGFQPVGVAFNEVSESQVTDFVKLTGATYPVGYSGRDPVLTFLSFSAIERFVVPQIVWIDRSGNIRSQTPPLGDENMLREPYWREMIEALLKERPGTASAKHTNKAVIP